MDDTVPIVDDSDRIIGYKKRRDLRSGDQIPITSIWLENGSGKVLIAQRHRTKDVNPLKWGPAAAGSVEKGETYEQNAYKELSEELGVTDVILEEYTKEKFEPIDRFWRFCMWYRLTLDWPLEKFTMQEDEVEQIKWVDKAWLKQDIADNPDNYVPSAQSWPELFNL